MLITAVLCNYNGGEYLREAIESVLNQTRAPDEFIVVDDASTDNSREIIAEFHRQHRDVLIPVFQSSNLGQAAGFNAAAAVARGDILSFIDSDDTWFPQKLKRVDDYFGGAQNAALFEHNLALMRDRVVTTARCREHLVTGNYFELIKRTREVPTFVPTSGLSVPLRILKRILPIPKDFKTCADGFMTRTCYCYGDVGVEMACFGCYRVHSSNATFENPNFDSERYANDLLLPKLNTYYRNNNIDFEYRIRSESPPASRPGRIKLLDRALDVSARKVLRRVKRIMLSR